MSPRPTHDTSVATIVGLGLVLAAGSVLASPERVAAHGGWSPYRDSTEQSSVAATDVAAIYEVVLRFYRPPRHQSRWLDLRLLPATRDDRVPGTIERALGEQIVDALGRDWCLLEPSEARTESCSGRRHDQVFLGAELRLSEIYATTPDRARVIVSCRLVWTSHQTTENGSQAFLLDRTPEGWRILDRHGVGP